MMPTLTAQNVGVQAFRSTGFSLCGFELPLRQEKCKVTTTQAEACATKG